MSYSKNAAQQVLPGMSGPPLAKVVNVASVPQRSPFRYPGGKTWLIPRVRQWLGSQPKRPKLLVEPFTGGGIVGLTAGFERLAEHIILVELDTQVAAVWQTILSADAEWLCQKILTYKLTYENVKEELSRDGGSVRERGFRTILKNRTYHGGILAPGSSLLKAGENGRGLHSRWYAETLAGRIRAIAEIRDRFTFIEGDGVAVMKEYAHRKQAAYFVDPPYTAGGSGGKRAGKRLYTHHELNHEEVFEVAARAVGDVLLTYDDAPDVRALAIQNNLKCVNVAMKNTHHATMKELLIGKSLEWLM